MDKLRARAREREKLKGWRASARVIRGIRVHCTTKTGLERLTRFVPFTGDDRDPGARFFFCPDADARTPPQFLLYRLPRDGRWRFDFSRADVDSYAGRRARDSRFIGIRRAVLMARP